MKQSTKDLRRFKKLAVECFAEGRYDDALKYYSFAKEIKPEDRDIEVGVLLSSLAYDLEEEAQAIFEFFTASKEIDKANAHDMILSLITSVESGYESMLDNISVSVDEFSETEDGISYKDFKNIVKEEDGDFKDIFKKVIFSTKVVITQKEDFFEFVETLIQNGYIEMALNYIDSANSIFPSDERIRDLLNLINQIEQLEITDK